MYMPRYYFSSFGALPEPDEDGVDLADIAAAREMALRFAGEVLQGEPAMVSRHGQWRVEVTDDAGALVFTVTTVAVDTSSRGSPLGDGTGAG